MCELIAMEGCVKSVPAKAASSAKPAKPGLLETLPKKEAELAAATDPAEKAKLETAVAKMKADKAKAETDLKNFETNKTSMMGLEKPWFQLKNPGLISIPLGFLTVILFSLFTRDRRSDEMWDELYVRQNTGIHAEGASAH
jgi:cation/acetate symporter